LRCAVAAKFPAMQCLVVPVNDIEGGYAYPAEVRFEGRRGSGLHIHKLPLSLPDNL
jgi:hypothetical protein